MHPGFAGTATLKVPPGWSRENNESYSFRTWVADLILWSMGTDVEVERQASLAAMQITGVAKELSEKFRPTYCGMDRRLESLA